MRIDTNNDEVLYIQCPYCGKGWYAPIKYIDIDYYRMPDGSIAEDIITPLGNVYIKSYVVQGLNDTDVSKEITCLNCGHEYLPINPVTGEGYARIMWDFVANGIVTVKG